MSHLKIFLKFKKKQMSSPEFKKEKINKRLFWEKRTEENRDLARCPRVHQGYPAPKPKIRLLTLGGGQFPFPPIPLFGHILHKTEQTNRSSPFSMRTVA